MRKFLLLILLLPVYLHAGYDPGQDARELIRSEYCEKLYSPVMASAIRAFSLVRYIERPAGYIIFTTPELMFDVLTSGTSPAVTVTKSVFKDLVTVVVQKAVKHPEEVTRKIANGAYKKGLDAYLENYKLYKKYSGIPEKITTKDAQKFVKNYYIQNLTNIAKELYNDIRSYKKEGGTLDSTKHSKFINKFDAILSNKKLSKKAMYFEIYKLSNDSQIGLGAYPPYLKYREKATTLWKEYSIRVGKASRFSTKKIKGASVVTDNISGLMWQRDVEKQTETDLDIFQYCGKLNYAGFNDWRLPDEMELKGLISGCSDKNGCEKGKGSGENGLYWEKGVWNPKGSAQSSLYLTATQPSMEGVLAVDFSTGKENLEHIYSTSARIRCVRGEKSKTVKKNETINRRKLEKQAENRISVKNITEEKTIQQSNECAIYMNFAITEKKYKDRSDWDLITKETCGENYRVADWNDLVSFHGKGGDLIKLFDNLGIKKHGSSVYLKNNGIRNSGKRFYFASRHEHKKPGNYLAHKNIENFLISLGSWWGSKKILMIKK